MQQVEDLARLLLQAERQSVDRAGTLVVPSHRGGLPAGRLLVENGRFCWATALARTQHLSSALARASGLDPERMAAIVKECAAAEQPLGEHMVATGLVSAEALRETLRAHVAGAIAALILDSKRADDWYFEPSRLLSYRPEFTFAGTEMLTTVLELEPELAVAAGLSPKAFRAAAVFARSAISFRETGRRGLPAVPLVAHGLAELGLEAALALYAMGRSLLRAPALRASRVEPEIVVTQMAKQGWVVTEVAGELWLFRIETQFEVAQVLSHLRAARQ